MAVLSIYASRIMSMSTPAGVVSLKRVHLFAMDHCTGSRTTTHMGEEVQLP